MPRLSSPLQKPITADGPGLDNPGRPILWPTVISEVSGPYPSSGGNATMALVLGIVGLVGGLGSCCCCFFTVLAVCAPIGWYVGHKELQDIRAGRAPASGEGTARAGMICGMVGTGILALYAIAVMAYVALVGFAVAFEALKNPGGLSIPR
jgi:hypothetical protein